MTLEVSASFLYLSLILQIETIFWIISSFEAFITPQYSVCYKLLTGLHA